jgi:1-deoxy-D-xylulose-5-phosphate reductoisomerase
MKRVVILGSTGSIGRNTLRVIAALNEKSDYALSGFGGSAKERKREGGFQVVGLSAYSNVTILLKQAKRFSPKWICLVDEFSAKRARLNLPSSCNVLSGRKGLQDLIQKANADIVVLAITGADALMPLVKAIRCKKTIILANKEALVIAGSIIMPRIKENQVKILPVDSEQSAIWQCLQGREKSQVKRIYLTASGGPFKNYNSQQLKGISVRDVLSHPCWRMGERITVDSATLMNKGLEVIEAMWLFGLRLSQIEVIIHPQAVIHSMVEFLDGVVLAQLSITDMRIPIQYALTYPAHLANALKPLDFFKFKRIDFQKPDTRRFPCLRLALGAAKEGGSMPCVLNAADELAVGAFLNKRINFIDIPRIIAKVMNRHKKITNLCLEEILATDDWARTEARRIIDKSQTN